MDYKEITRLVEGYLVRMQKGDVPQYSLKEKGIYRIFSGLQDIQKSWSRFEFAIVEGKFIDVISYTVQQTLYLHCLGGLDFADHLDHGKVVKVDVEKLNKNNSLDSLLGVGK